MVHFTWFSSAALFYSCSQCMHHCMRVTPFGYPRVIGYVLLTVAFRSLSRPSSPYSSIGIRHRPIFRLTILSFPPPKSTPALPGSSVKRTFPHSQSQASTFRLPYSRTSGFFLPFSSSVKEQISEQESLLILEYGTG